MSILNGTCKSSEMYAIYHVCHISADISWILVLEVVSWGKGRLLRPSLAFGSFYPAVGD